MTNETLILRVLIDILLSLSEMGRAIMAIDPRLTGIMTEIQRNSQDVKAILEKVGQSTGLSDEEKALVDEGTRLLDEQSDAMETILGTATGGGGTGGGGAAA
jgi:hypothetical protein